MTADRRILSDDELRELLNLGDPAGDGNEPAPEELNAMRRTVLNSIDTTPAVQPGLLRPYVTAAATIAVALIALTILLRAGPWGAVPQPETGPATPAEPVPGVTTESTPAESVAAAEEIPAAPPTEKSHDPAVAAEARDAAIAEVPGSAEEPPTLATVEDSPNVLPSTVARKPRTVQFTAPGGTRVFWTLDPDFKLPVSVPDDRARGEL
jgi:hypothetical protein